MFSKIFFLQIYKKFIIALLLLLSFSLNAQDDNAKADIYIESIDITHVTGCYGNSNGSVTINAAGGTQPYEYSIDNGTNWQSSDTFSGLSYGTYTLRVRDFYGQTAQSYANVHQPPPIFISNEEYENVTGCYGDANGSITITAEGGTGDLSYSINGGTDFFASNSFNNLPAGTYNIAVRDENACIKNGTEITISQPEELLIEEVNYLNVSGCYGYENGNIAIDVSGGTSPIFYTVDGGTSFNTGGSFSGLAAGTYNIYVEDNEGCTDDYGTLTLTQPDELIIDDISVQDVDCNGDNTGKVEIFASGGTGTLEYSVSGGGNYTEFSVFDDLYADTYEITVKDNNGCINYGQTVEINEPPRLIVTDVSHTDVTGCFGDETGSITITAEGGTPDYFYSIDGGTNYGSLNQNTFTDLPASTYTIIVQDANGCTEYAPEPEYISQPNIFNIYNVSSSNVNSCYGDNTGDITALAYGGTPGYSYTIDDWNTVYTSGTINDIPAGSYELIGQDANGCIDTFETIIEITQPDELVINNIESFDLTCFENMDGRISINASGGTGNLYYSVDNGNSWVSSSIIENLSADTPYEIKVRDGNSCITSGPVITLDQPDEIIFDNIDAQDINSCFGEANGSIEITLTGGTPDYEYSINGGSDFSTNNLFENLEAGNYQLFVKDSENCQKSGPQITLSQPDQLLITGYDKTNIQGCKGDALGSISIEALGGTAPIYYSINGGTDFQDSNPTFNNLTAGSYNTFIKDANGCTKEGAVITINEPDTLTANITQLKNVSCYGASDGKAYFSGNGGQPPYKFSINGADYTLNTQFFDLPAGNYTSRIIDNFDCERPGPSFEIIEPDELTITDVSYQHVEQCYGQATGNIQLSTEGGTPEIYYSINNGSSFSSNGNFQSLTAGDYNIVVEDINGCRTEYNQTITLTQPEELLITDLNTENIQCYNETNGSIEFTAEGGTGQLIYSIDNGANTQADNLFTGLPAGSYHIYVEDENGCIEHEPEIFVYEPDSLQIGYIIVEDESCQDFGDGIVRIVAFGGTPPFEYFLNDQSYSSSTITDLPPGTYSPYITDAHGCEVYHEELEIESAQNSALFSADTLSGCSPLPVSFTRDNDLGRTYHWNFGDGEISGQTSPTHTFENTSPDAQEYNVMAVSLSNEHNCRDTAYLNITVYPQPQLSFQLSADSIWYPETTVDINNLSPPGYTDYIWDFDDGTTSNAEHPGSHTYDTCDDYILSLSAQNQWCSNQTQDSLVIVPSLPEMEIQMDTTNGCTPLTIQFADLSENYESVNWTINGENFENLPSEYTFIDENSYTIRADVNGYCNVKSTYDTLVTVWESPVAEFYASPDSVLPPEQPVRCHNTSLNGYSYFWDFGDGTTSNEIEPVHQYYEEGTYDIKLVVTTDKSCVDSVILYNEVYVLPYGRVKFPNAFSPNNDGENDLFKPADYGAVREYQMHIFNRWGELMFSTTDPDVGWDGTYRGEKCAQDVYVWMIEGVYENNKPFSDAGDLTLIR